jgi:hypothetical protein
VKNEGGDYQNGNEKSRRFVIITVENLVIR